MTVMRHCAILFKPPQVSVDLTVTESKKEKRKFYNQSRYQPLFQVYYSAPISKDFFMYLSKENSGKPWFGTETV